MEWTALHERAEDLVGIIPQFLIESDPRPAREQFDERYSFGGGWRPMSGWKLDQATGAIKYPGDPAYKPVAVCRFRDETIYAHLFQPAGTMPFESAVSFSKFLVDLSETVVTDIAVNAITYNVAGGSDDNLS